MPTITLTDEEAQEILNCLTFYRDISCPTDDGGDEGWQSDELVALRTKVEKQLEDTTNA